ncbi:unnamed protein product [Sphagnum jensenii]|uniref:Fructose-2,6-bisphosphatase n=1 Tax=Sphagnum jensenii TaxID=128206 RepID=A0ABP1C286_9BRYO
MGAMLSVETEGVDELQQEPEVAPCHPSSSPLSPHVTYLGPSVRVSDPYNILNASSRLQSMVSAASSPPNWVSGDEDVHTEVYLIRHAESTMNAHPELVGGRSPLATLTALGKRQAHALGVHLRSLGVDFDAVYSSPLERAKQTAFFVCQELDIPKNVVEIAEALQELSQGQWEGQPRKEVYTARMLPLINATQPDFCAPGGESQRQVEFRMVEFLNNTVLHRAFAAMQEARLQHQRGSEDALNAIPQSSIQVHPLEEAEMCRAKEWEISTKDDNVFEAVRENVDGVKLCKEEDETPDSTGSYGELRAHDDLASMSQALPYCAAVFTHGMAIKCLLRGLLGSDAHMTRRWCIDNSSISVLRHSTSQGWEIQRINDTSHLHRL